MTQLVTDSELLRIASEDSIEPVEGGLAIYRGDLSEQSAFRYSRRIQFWPWGRNAGSIASGTLEISNRNGQYDELVTLDMRNRAAALRVRVGGTEQPIVTPIVDSVEGVLDKSIRVKLKDPLVLFDIPLQVPTFDDTADTNIEGRNFPILIGVARSIPIILWEANFNGGAYRLNYAPLSGIGGVYDRGVQLDPTTTPPQWEFDIRIGNAGIVLENQTVGPITADASATGDGILPPSPTDELNGEGQFDTPFDGAGGPEIAGTTVGMPPGWTHRTRNSGLTGNADLWGWSYTSGNGGYMRGATGGAGGNATGWIEAIYTGTGGTPFRLQAGKTYRWTVRIAREVTGGFADPPQNKGFLIMYAGPRASSSSSQTSTGPSSHVIRRWNAFSPDGGEGVYTGLFTVPATANNQEVIFRMGGSGAGAGFDEVTFIEVPEPQNIALPGVLLKDYILEVFRLAERPESLLNVADLDAIDPDAREIGYYTDQPVQALSMIRVPLDSYSADVYSDRPGLIRFARMRDPALDTPDLTVDPDNIKGQIRVYLDPAKGLTTQVTAARNYYVHSPSDLARSILDLPLDQRAQYTQDDRFTAQAVVPDGWPEQYRHAIGAKPLRTLYDDIATALAELQRIVDLYANLRWFVEAEVYLDVLEQLPDLNQVARVVWPRYNLSEGRNMIICRVEDVVSGTERRQTARLLLWG